MSEYGFRGANNTRNTRQKGRGNTRDAQHTVLKHNFLYEGAVLKEQFSEGAIVKAHVVEGAVAKVQFAEGAVVKAHVLKVLQ